MAERPRSKPEPLRGTPAVVAIALVVVSIIGGGWWGYSLVGAVGMLLGVMLGGCIGALAFTVIRATAQVDQFAERPAPDVRELPPDQALQVLSALMVARGTGDDGAKTPELGGGLLKDIARARDIAASGDLDGATAKLRALAEAHPRSPAVPAELARVRCEANDVEGARANTSRALQLALDGGMNKLAGRLFAELDPDDADHIELDPRAWSQLAKVAALAGNEAGAALCKLRLASRDDAEPG